MAGHEDDQADARSAVLPTAGSEPTAHQLRLFLVVAEELHFGRAAARLFMTQPALSRQLQALEQRLGVRLLNRTSRSVEVTGEGMALLPAAKEVIAAMDRLRRTAEAQARRVSGRLVVGSIGGEAAMPHTRAILRTLRDRYPHLTVEIRVLNFAEHITDLLNGDLDVAILHPPVPEGIQTQHLVTKPRIACLPADDELASRSEISLAELADRPFVDVPPQVPRFWWDFWAVDPRPDGSRVRYGPVVSDLEALLHTVAEGIAIAFLPDAARDLFPRRGISYVKVADLPPYASALAWPAANRNRPSIAAIRQVATTLVSTET